MLTKLYLFLKEQIKHRIDAKELEIKRLETEIKQLKDLL